MTPENDVGKAIKAIISEGIKHCNKASNNITDEENSNRLNESNEMVKLAKKYLKNELDYEQIDLSTDKIKDLYKKAEEYLNNAINIYKNNAEAYFLLGIIYESRGHLDNAVDEYKKATKLDKNYTEANLHLGVLYLLKGDYKNARKKFESSANNNIYAKLCLGLIDYIIVGKGAKEQGLKYINMVRDKLPNETMNSIELAIKNINPEKKDCVISDKIISAIHIAAKQETMRHL